MRTLPIDQITPYWRNPRRIPEEAVAAAADSIERYGYRQPIVVDTENVVIVGHTRLQALQRLGWTEVPVRVSDMPAETAHEYRLVDNKVAEMTSWDHDALVAELREFDQGLYETYFPDVDLEVGLASQRDPDFDKAERDLAIPPSPELARSTTHVACPACDKEFEVWTKTLPGVTDEILREIADGPPE